MALARAGRGTTFEADIVPNFVIRQSFFDVIADENATRIQQRQDEFRFAWSIVGVPMVRLRMFKDDPSAPVKTPSYMPKGTGQLLWFKLLEERVHVLAAQATVGHHSNGQDGCLFQNRDPKRDCAPVPPLDSSFVPVNREDGSFSTNYNLGFQDDVRRLQIGMTYSQEGFLRFRPSP